MTLKEIIKDIATKTKLKASDVDNVIHFYHAAMVDEVVAGGKYNINNFGSFTVLEKKARNGRNPKTGEPIEIPASKAVKFKVAKFLKDNIQ